MEVALFPYFSGVISGLSKEKKGIQGTLACRLPILLLGALLGALFSWRTFLKAQAVNGKDCSSRERSRRPLFLSFFSFCHIRIIPSSPPNKGKISVVDQTQHFQMVFEFRPMSQSLIEIPSSQTPT